MIVVLLQGKKGRRWDAPVEKVRPVLVVIVVLGEWIVYVMNRWMT